MSINQQLLKKATFALACFWGPESLYGCAPGVWRTRVGYCGGKTSNPSYHRLADHTEAVDIDFDPTLTTYEELLKLFWNNHDPTIQRERQYMSIIFYHDENQKKLAVESKERKENVLKTNVVTKILPFEIFYEAENYHQKYILQTYHRSLCKSVGVSGKELAGSHVTTRLNGYVGRHGNLDSFNAEWEILGLSPDWADYVRKQIIHGSRANY